MKFDKKLVFCLIGVFFMVLLVCMPLGVSKIDNNFNKIEKRVLKELETQQKAKVIVTFNDYSNFSKNIDKVNKILGSQKVKNGSSSLNGFSAELTKTEIEKLSNEGSIGRILPNRNFKTSLQDSTKLVNATLSWNLQINNFNLTGAGETICIIDTGVNYTHPDLGGCYGNNSNFSCKVVGGYDFVNSDNNPLDDNGHGTHVAGIVAANGTIRGVAPDARIVALKVLGSTGSGSDSDILSAIDWCVNNAATFNITVISMSLGIDCDSSPEYCYSNYCDSQDAESFYRDSINAAFAKNISVVAATGNDGKTTGFSSPACIKNATRVASVSKSDVFSSFSNRGANFQILLAPGEDINSTMIKNPAGTILASCGTGNIYCSLQGTSMATPHVSGAIAVMRQYLRVISVTKTPFNLENILNNTGKAISDAGTSKNYMRINLYSALLNLDLTAPSVTLVNPANGTLNQSGNITFKCNATDWQLANITFYLWNATSEVNKTNFVMNGTFNSTEINISGIPALNYKWNCLSSDLNGNFAFAASNFSFSFGNISVNLNTPGNNTFTNTNLTYFNCSAQVSQSFNLSNITFYLWNSTNNLVYNETKNISGSSNASLFNYTFVYQDRYNWNCLGVNNVSTRVYAETNETLAYDVISPDINLSSPSNGTSDTTTGYNFTFNVTDNYEVENCTLFVDGARYNYVGSVVSGALSGMYNSSLSVATHTWSINCTDKANNPNNSSSRSFTVSAAPVTSSPGGGGGGGSTETAVRTFSISESDVIVGYTQTLAANEVIMFTSSIGSTGSHSLTVNKVESSFVNFTFRSNPINVILYVGQERKINTTLDYYDFYLKLNSIVNGKANITIKEIHEDISKQTIKINNNQTNNTMAGEVNDKNLVNYWPIVYVVGGVLIVIVVIFIIIYSMRKNKNSKRKR